MTASKVWCCGAEAGVPAAAGGAAGGALTSSARSVASRSASAEPGSACSARRRSSTCHHTTVHLALHTGNNLTHDGAGLDGTAARGSPRPRERKNQANTH